MITVFNVLIACFYSGFDYLPKQPVSISNRFYPHIYYDGDGTPRTNKLCHHMYGPRSDLNGGSMQALDGGFYTRPPFPNPESLESFSPSP